MIKDGEYAKVAKDFFYIFKMDIREFLDVKIT